MHAQILAARPPGRRGFTLIELLVVIAIIGVLVALLLPAIQQVRKTSNHEKLMTEVFPLLHSAGETFHNAAGFYPDNLSDLGALIPPELAFGALHGHNFEVTLATSTMWRVRSTPWEPGVSGDFICTMTETGDVTCVPHDNAAKGARQLEQRILTRSLNTLLELAGVDNRAWFGAGAHVGDADFQQAIFDELGRDRAGMIGFDELLDADRILASAAEVGRTISHPDGDATVADNNDIRAILERYLAGLADDLRLGVANEDLSGVGIMPSPIADLDPIGLPPHTWEKQKNMTEILVDHPGVANSLVRQLDAAEAADDRGNDRAKSGAKNAYLNHLRAQTGKSVEEERASLLTRFLEILCPGGR